MLKSDKKLLYYGQDARNDSFYTQDQIDRMNTPDANGIPEFVFDGMVIRIDLPNGQNQFDDKVFDQTFSSPDLRKRVEDRAISNLSNKQWGRLGSRFLIVCPNSPSTKFDWFDDRAWQVVLDNWDALVTIAFESQCNGIFIDPEPYTVGQGRDILISEQSDGIIEHSIVPKEDLERARLKRLERFKRLMPKAFERGVSLMEAALRIYRKDVNRTITILFAGAHSLNMHWEKEKQRYATYPSNDPNGVHILLSAFVDGMIKAGEREATFHDLAEQYCRRTFKEFNQTGPLLVRSAAQVAIDDAARERYEKKMRYGCSVWLNPYSNPWNPLNPYSNFYSPDQLYAAVCNALDNSLELVWIYSENSGGSYVLDNSDAGLGNSIYKHAFIKLGNYG